MSALASLMDAAPQIRPAPAPAIMAPPRPLPAPRAPRVALLGCGTVGGALARVLLRRARRDAAAPRLTNILVRDARRDRGLDPALLTDDPAAILDARPDAVVEALGGVHPAAEYVASLLARGIGVVTANKSLIAHHGEELGRIAARSGAALAFEAAVGGAVPLLAALRHLRGQRVRSIEAVLNGTTSDILCRMSRTGCTLEAALAEARRLGLAEPDPSADLSGRDAAEKLCILGRAIGLRGLHPRDVRARALASLTADRLAAAARLGCVVRQVAELGRGPGPEVECCVGPALLPRCHPLARLEGAAAGAVIEGGLAGRLVLSGPGAGPLPTTSALLGDLRRVTRRGPRPAPRDAPARDGRARVAAGEGRARPHLLAFDRVPPAAPPQRVLEVAAGHGAAVRHVSFHRAAMELVTGPLTTPQAERLAHALGAHPATALVAPILQHDPRGVSG